MIIGRLADGLFVQGRMSLKRDHAAGKHDMQELLRLARGNPVRFNNPAIDQAICLDIKPLPGL